MDTETFIERFTPSSRRTFALGLGLVLAVVAATIIAGACYVRSLVRQQIASRDAQALYATVLMEQLDVKEEAEGQLGDEEMGFEAALRASRLEGVIGIRFFDNEGRFSDSFPANIQAWNLQSAAQDAVARTRPIGIFHPRKSLSDVFIYLPEFATNVARAPILEVAVPLHRRDGTNRAGAAQFILQGHGIAAEYAWLDTNLWWLSAATMLVASLLLVGMLWPVFRKLERLHTELAARSERLLRANQELALAARTSALGAVSAHLMHGLKNPLASLSQFVRDRAGPGSPGSNTPDNGQDALGAARRMQVLMEETLEVLADARGEPGYDIGIGELLDSVRQRVGPQAARRQVILKTAVQAGGNLSSRTANLLKLVLVNLAQNAVEVTPPGKAVSLLAGRDKDLLRFTIRDSGSGFPEHLRNSLFLPCSSTREGGSGLGLAISKQIADHLGAKLDLRDSSAAGCTFVLEMSLPSPLPPPAPGTHPVGL